MVELVETQPAGDLDTLDQRWAGCSVGVGQLNRHSPAGSGRSPLSAPAAAARVPVDMAGAEVLDTLDQPGGWTAGT